MEEKNIKFSAENKGFPTDEEKTQGYERKNVIIFFLSVISIPFFIMMIVEILNRRAVPDAFKWLTKNPAVVVSNFIVYFLLYAVLVFLFSKSIVPKIIYILFFVIIGAINHFKGIMNGSPLFPWDYMMTGESIKMLNVINFKVDECVLTAAGVLFVVVGICILTVKFPVKIDMKFKAAVPVIFTVMLSIFYYNVSDPDGAIHWGYQNVQWNQTENYESNGFIMAFSMNLHAIKIKKPENYNQENVEAIKPQTTMPAVELPKKPNIIAVMAEAYGDIRKMNSQVEFIEDPFEPLSEIKGNHVMGQILSPVFGGNTANAEYEFLSGFNMANYPAGTIAYQQYVKKDGTPGLTKTLNDQGYRSIAVHPYYRDFWDREDVYKRFGFERYYAIEDFNDPIYKLEYVSNYQMGKTVIEQYEEKDPAKPLFCFAVTIQNHFPFTDEDVETYVDSGDLELYDDMVVALNSHSDGVKDTTEMIKYLTDYFYDVEEPTMIVVFGDHQPSMKFLYEKEEKEDNPLERFANLYKTPCMIWTNYDVELEEFDVLGIDYLSAYVIRYAGVEHPEYYDLMYEDSKQIKGFGPNIIIDQFDEYYRQGEKLPPNLDMILKKSRMIQYDVMFGKGYTLNTLWKKP